MVSAEVPSELLWPSAGAEGQDAQELARQQEEEAEAAEEATQAQEVAGAGGTKCFHDWWSSVSRQAIKEPHGSLVWQAARRHGFVQALSC